MAYTQLAPFHSTGVTSLNFSPDGLLLCSTSLDGTVALWDRNELKPVPLVGHQDSVNCSVFFSDSARLVTAGEDAHALLWDVRNPSQPVGQFNAMGSGVNVLALGQNGTILYSASDDGCVVLHDVATGEVVDKFMVGSDAVNDLQVLDGAVQGLDLLIVGSEDKSVRTWLGGRPADVAAFREVHPAPEPIDDEEEMELDEEAIAARAAAAASHRNTRLLDSADEFEMAINHVHYDSNSGTLFAACANCVFEVAINVSTGMLNRETDAVAYEGHNDFVRGFVTGINAEGHRVLYTAGDDRLLAEWRPGQATTPVVCHNDAHDDMIMAMAGSPCGGLLATGSEDSVIRIWALPLH